MARCLVIGANGFLGSHLVDELVSRGHEVTAFDRFSTSTLMFGAEGVAVLAGDFTRSPDLQKALVGQQLVFHFVSASTPFSADNDPALDVRTNVAPSVELFKLCVEAGVDRVFFASTGGAIYGDQPFDASELSLPQPISPYAIGKLAIEHYLGYFRRRHGLESLALRISNPYGPRQHSSKVQGVIPIFLRRVHAGLPITVYGDGSMIRDYIYVTDAARMIAETVGRVTEHSLYNIGSGHGASVNELLAIISATTGIEPAIQHQPVPTTFVDHVVLDTSRHSAEFGAHSLVPIAEGIERTWRAILREKS